MSASPVERTPFERFCAVLATLIANRDGRASHALHDRLVAEFRRDVPNATHDERNRAMALIAKASGL